MNYTKICKLREEFNRSSPCDGSPLGINSPDHVDQVEVGIPLCLELKTNQSPKVRMLITKIKAIYFFLPSISPQVRSTRLSASSSLLTGTLSILNFHVFLVLLLQNLKPSPLNTWGATSCSSRQARHPWTSPSPPS